MLSIVRLTILSLFFNGVYQPVSASNNNNNIVETNDTRRPNLLLESSDVYSSIPTGSVISFAGTTAPQGWLLCDGKKYSNQIYPQLYSVIGTKYVPQNHWIHESNESTQPVQLFLVPDLRGRTVIGTDNSASRVTANNTLGASSGEEKHQLTIAEMPSHDHGIQNKPGTHLGGNYPYDIVVPNVIPNITILHRTDNSGGNQPHSIMQPYMVLNYIIKTGQEEANNQRNRIAQRDIELNNQLSKIAQLEEKLSNLEMASAKAWVVFNGTNAAILDSYNIASVIRNDSGNYTINFLKSFNSDNYCFVLNAGGGRDRGFDTYGPFYDRPTKTSFRLITCTYSTGGNEDVPFVSACFYGKQ